jgi:ribonuclease J
VRAVTRPNTDDDARTVQLAFLGGLDEIGKNMLAIRCGNDMLVIDAGLTFPEEEMLGIDIVIPDFSYVVENREYLRGIVITHGHEDHTGALPYLLGRVPCPVYGTRLTIGLVEEKLKEHGLGLPEGSRAIRPGDRVKAGALSAEFFHVNHSIPGSVGVIIDTPFGSIVHTGDFKFDHSPVDGEVTEFHRLAGVGQRGALALLSDSTNAEEPGYTPSERVVGAAMESIFRTAPGRVLVATFASNVHRIQQVFDAAAALGKKVAVCGRSMEKVVDVAAGLGYLRVPPHTHVRLEETSKLPAAETILLTTGSQGEPLSALSRIATHEHKRVEIMPGDIVIIAATPIPGNEKLVARTVDLLFKRGAHVIYQESSGVHVSGHASREELKLMLGLVRPRFFIPVHGEHRHLVHHRNMAVEAGIPPDNIFVLENGSLLTFALRGGEVTASAEGTVTAGSVLVDGLGVGDVGSIVLRDRRQLGTDGIVVAVLAVRSADGVIVGGPDVVSRGFVYVRESEELLELARTKVRDTLAKYREAGREDWTAAKNQVRDALAKFLFERTGRRPMVVPVVLELDTE